MECLTDHYRVFHKRVKAAPRETQLAVVNSFSGIPRGERQHRLLHWPLEQEQNNLTHVHLYRVPPHQYAEYAYFGFVCHYLRYGFRCNDIDNNHNRHNDNEEEEIATTPDITVLCLSPPEKRPDPLVRLLDWAGENLFATPRDLLSRNAMVPTDIDAGGYDGTPAGWYHWEPKLIDQLNYKSYFSLKNPRLSMRCIINTRVQVYYRERVQMAVSNAKLVIHGGGGGGGTSSFFGITIYVPGQSCPIELPISSFTPDASGNRTLDLVHLCGPDLECYVDSHGSSLTVVFGAERMGTLRMVAAHNDRNDDAGTSTCGLDIGMCELEYWSTEPLLFPSRYGIVDVEKYEQQQQQQQPHEHFWWAPICSQCLLQQEVAQIILLLRTMRVNWIKEVPFFFVQYDGGDGSGVMSWEQLAVVPTPGVCAWARDGVALNDWWTLFWRERAIAYCCLNPPYSDWNLAFRLIVGQEAQYNVFQMDQQYIY